MISYVPRSARVGWHTWQTLQVERLAQLMFEHIGQAQSSAACDRVGVQRVTVRISAEKGAFAPKRALAAPHERKDRLEWVAPGRAECATKEMICR